MHSRVSKVGSISGEGGVEDVLEDNLEKCSQYINPVVIKANQDRKNIFLEKVMRPHDNDKVKK